MWILGLSLFSLNFVKKTLPNCFNTHKKTTDNSDDYNNNSNAVAATTHNITMQC